MSSKISLSKLSLLFLLIFINNVSTKIWPRRTCPEYGDLLLRESRLRITVKMQTRKSFRARLGIRKKGEKVSFEVSIAKKDRLLSPLI